MHEMALVRGIIQTTLDEAEKANAEKVKTVYLSIGRGRDVVMDLFTGLFTHLAKGTACEDAELVVERVPLLSECNQCGKLFHLNVHDERTWVCPHCQVKDYSLYSGMEFSIDRIEVA